MTSFERCRHALTSDRARALIESTPGTQIVDVREAHEREQSRFPGSQHTPLQRLATALDDLDQSRPIIFYCRVGARGGMAAEAFQAIGWEAYNLSGGLMAWVDAGFDLDPSGAEIAEH